MANNTPDMASIALTYLDGFTELERAYWDQLVKDRPGAVQSILQQVYKYWGIPRQTDKAVSREFQVEDLGSLLDGLFGAMKTPHKFDIELATATYWFVRQRNPTQKELQVLSARWTRKVQYRRECSAVFSTTWKALQFDDLGVAKCKGLPFNIACELVHAVCLMPLMLVDFRLQANPLVIATDASEQGLGVCHSIGLTSLGRAKQAALARGRDNEGPTGIGLIELFAGLGAPGWRLTSSE